MSQKIKADSEVSRMISLALNKDIRGVENWRGLAFRLNIERGTYDYFHPSVKQHQQSPTKAILNWLIMSKPQVTIQDLKKVLEKIKRKDVIFMIDKHLKGD